MIARLGQYASIMRLPRILLLTLFVAVIAGPTVARAAAPV
jgi:hypothetical protein